MIQPLRNQAQKPKKKRKKLLQHFERGKRTIPGTRYLVELEDTDGSSRDGRRKDGFGAQEEVE